MRAAVEAGDPPCGCPGIVVDEARGAEGLVDDACDRLGEAIEVDREGHCAGDRVHVAGQAHTDGRQVPGQDLRPVQDVAGEGDDAVRGLVVACRRGATADHAILTIDEEREDAGVPLRDRMGLLDSAWRLLRDAAREDATIAARLKAELQALVGPEGPTRELIEDWKTRFPPPTTRSTRTKRAAVTREEEESDTEENEAL